MELEYDHPQKITGLAPLLVVWWKVRFHLLDQCITYLALICWKRKHRLRRWCWRQQVFDARGFHISWRCGHSLGRFFCRENGADGHKIIKLSEFIMYFIIFNWGWIELEYVLFLDYERSPWLLDFVFSLTLSGFRLTNSWLWGVFGVHGLGSSLAVGASGRCHYLECPWLKDAPFYWE